MSRYAWLGWAVPILLVALLSLREIGSADFWWQWAAGRHVLENGIPSVDPWLTTAEPRPWIEMRWLYCVGLYWSVENIGAWLAIICAAALYSVGLGFALNSGGTAHGGWIFYTPYSSSRSNLVGWTWRLSFGVLTVIAVGRRLAVRPEAFTFVFLGLLLFLVARVRQQEISTKWALVWIGVIQIAWANTHALFALGPALCGLWAIVEIVEKGRARKVALAAFALTCACSFINPYGLSGVLYPLTLFGELHGGAYRSNIVELRTPFAMGLSPSLIAHMFLAGAVLLCTVKRRGDVLLLCFAAVTFYLSVTAVRNVPLFGLAALAYLSSCPLVEGRASRAFSGAAIFAAICFAYMFAIGTWSIEDRIGLTINRSRYGLAAAHALVNENDAEPVFNTLVEGSLLEAAGKKAYCDPRLEVLPQERFLEMMAIARLKKPLPEEFQSALLILDSALAAGLAKRGGWRLVGMDSVAISFVREPGARVSVVELEQRAHAALPQNPPAFSWFRKSLSPTPYRRMSTFFTNLGEPQIAERFRDEARRIYPAQ